MQDHGGGGLGLVSFGISEALIGVVILAVLLFAVWKLAKLLWVAWSNEPLDRCAPDPQPLGDSVGSWRLDVGICDSGGGSAWESNPARARNARSDRF